MGKQGDGPVDDKANVRDLLDVDHGDWRRAEPEGQHLEDPVEYAFVAHTDGVTYVAVRSSEQRDGPVLIFTPAEWEAFVAGVRDGEFDGP